MKQNNREYQKAIRYLCSEMRDGRIAVGERLPTERYLAEVLEISRNSTREALRSLEHMGIIESRQGSGNYFTGNVSKKVSELLRLLILIQIVSQQEICDFRRTMEKSVCMSIMDHPSLDLSEIEVVLNQPISSIEEEIEKDRQFHLLLVQKSENRFWIELMNAVCDVYREWIAVFLQKADSKKKQELDQVHRRILNALKKRDRIACESAINEHYDMIDQAILP